MESKAKDKTGFMLAQARGFTRELLCSFNGASAFILVREAAKLDGYFEAWDIDRQYYTTVNGAVCQFEEA